MQKWSIGEDSQDFSYSPESSISKGSEYCISVCTEYCQTMNSTQTVLFLTILLILTQKAET